MERFENDGDIPPAIHAVALNYKVSVASIIDTLNSHGFGYDLNQPDFEITSEIDSLLDDVYLSSKVEEENPSPSESILDTSEVESIDGLKKNKINIYKREGITVKIGIELWPTDEDVLIVSIDDSLQLVDNSLHGLVLSKIGSSIDSVEFNAKDYAEISNAGLVSRSINGKIIYFISTIHQNDDLIKSDLTKIQRNIFRVLNEFDSNISFPSPSIYLPLLGTGYSRIPVMHSFDMTISAIEELVSASKTQMSIILSLPSDISDNNLNIITKYFHDRWDSIELKNIDGDSFISNKIDKIDFHLDDPALEDKLGRRPIAKSLAKLINGDIFAPDKQTSSAYMVHLQGKWGEGKTSFLNFLEEELSTNGEKKWVVVKYNAWKNQHIDPPWWTFIESLSQKGKETFKAKTKIKYFKFLNKQLFRRLNYQALTKLILVSGILLLIISTLHFFGGDSLSTDWINTFLIYLTFGSTLFVIGKEWNKFFLGNSESAQLFMERVEDPTKQITQHFEKLVDSIIQSDKKMSIAFFIDDLDRCNADYVVKLLEGIQTLFRSRNILYLVAADKDWIAKSFETIYEDFRPVAADRGATLGNFFVEKNFQLSIRLPKPSEPQIEKYWDYILKAEEKKQSIKQEDRVNFEKEVNKYNKDEILSGNLNIEDLAARSEKSLEEAQSFILEKLDQNKEDVHHLLKDYNEIVGTNARTIKRIANQYTIFRNLILLERNKVDQAKLFRWLVLVNRFPLFIDILQERGLDSIETLKSNLKILNERRLHIYSDSILDIIGNGEEKLTQEDVKIFMGT